MRETLVTLRRDLHRHPSLSEKEQPTADRLAAWLREHAPGRFVEGLGGAGLAVIYEGSASGPTVLLRAELDALPIAEGGELDHESALPGVSHKCGHDGHMALLAGVASMFSRVPPEAGRVVALFQPAEEIGTGARAVIADPRYAELRPDFAFALHNLPGFPSGAVAVRQGTFAAASEGLEVRLTGASSHASEPHLGTSPALALSQLIQALLALPAQHLPMDGCAAVAVTHARLGEPSFGVAAGDATVQATLRASTTADLQRLMAAAERVAAGLAQAQGLDAACSRHDRFAATVNDPDAVGMIERAASDCELSLAAIEGPFPWSEDFGEFLAGCRGAMFGLGAGPECAPLHNEYYDFPDELLEPGALALAACASIALEGGAR